MERFAAAGLLACLLFAVSAVEVAAQPACPFKSSDQCGQWHFEQLDGELAGVVAAVSKRIGEFAHAQSRQEAQDSFMEAQRTWVALRDRDCQAESAFMWLRSAMTRAGYTAGCKSKATSDRIAALRQRYLLKN
jgi:uncharacterized protein YecT (DUF1311 family)